MSDDLSPWAEDAKPLAKRRQVVATVLDSGHCRYYRKGRHFIFGGFTPAGVSATATAPSVARATLTSWDTGLTANPDAQAFRPSADIPSRLGPSQDMGTGTDRNDDDCRNQKHTSRAYSKLPKHMECTCIGRRISIRSH